MIYVDRFFFNKSKVTIVLFSDIKKLSLRCKTQQGAIRLSQALGYDDGKFCHNIHLIFLFYYFIKSIKIYIGNKFKFIGMILVLLSMIMAIHNPLAYKNALLGELQTFTQVQKTPDLKEYLSNPSLVSTQNQHPQNVVMIIGESFNKSHSSLYIS